KTMLITGTPAFDEKGDIDIIVVNERDMTKLNTLREQLEHSNRMTEKIKDELAGLSQKALKKQAIIAESKAMRRVIEMSIRLSRIDASNILILGESGVGKGVLATFICKNSRRGKKPFIQINCAAVPENLLEAELFGYEKGAFTGAGEKGKVGLFELAHNGTLFLDEIGEMPLSLQAKLLKYLDDHEVMRLGGVNSHRIDCMVIAATNLDLEEQVKKKKFRKDLYYRLNTFPIHIPPLRERPEDIFELGHHFLHQYNRKYGLEKKLPARTLKRLQEYPFPGNVRELKNIIKKAVVMSDDPNLDDIISKSLSSATNPVQHIGSGIQKKGSLTNALLAVERNMLIDAMKHCRTLDQLAGALGISTPTAFRKMKKHGLSL
ncbi:MAG: sigma-54-dependent Fis family transcriptional regulator, partial [Deltaproteobacteria bacterium]|nr:sigma-54-dependent Fis family transcriptional regulator [Deltaproteobacteria bacterium]